MIISHKHKFIFIKTHKTSTQTFMKFIKPHLGADDVMAGDPSNDVNEDTKLNVDKKFESTGKSAHEYVEVYGNHLPWFMIKDIVGDDIWNNYTKITIERDPHDRLVSLFHFLNNILIKPGLFQPSPDYRSQLKGPEIKDMLQNSLLDLYPEEIRTYFEELTLMQLSTPVMNLTDHDTYGPIGVERERSLYKNTARDLNLKIYDVDDSPLIINNKLGPFPYLNTSDICIRLEPFQKHQASEGQCRFLNYGYYHDGDRLQVDEVIDFKDVGNNIGNTFQKYGINIKCDESLYNNNSQNTHYRSTTSSYTTDWWYEGPRAFMIKELITQKFLPRT